MLLTNYPSSKLLAWLLIGLVVALGMGGYLLLRRWSAKKEKPTGEGERKIALDKELLAQIPAAEYTRLFYDTQRFLEKQPFDSPLKKMAIESVMTSRLNDETIEKLWEKAEAQKSLSTTQERIDRIKQSRPSPMPPMAQPTIEHSPPPAPSTTAPVAAQPTIEHSPPPAPSTIAPVAAQEIKQERLNSEEKLSEISIDNKKISISSSFAKTITITNDDEGGIIIKCSPGDVLASQQIFTDSAPANDLNKMQNMFKDSRMNLEDIKNFSPPVKVNSVEDEHDWGVNVNSGEDDQPAVDYDRVPSEEEKKHQEEAFNQLENVATMYNK